MNPEPFLLQKAAEHFVNTSPLDMKKLMGDQDHIRQNLIAYVDAVSPAVRSIFEAFDFPRRSQCHELAGAWVGSGSRWLGKSSLIMQGSTRPYGSQ